MPIGYLKVTSLTAKGNLPVSYAMVEVTQKINGISRVLYSYSTDVNGYSDPVELEAPDKSLSLEKLNEIQPYSCYNISVTAEGYEEVNISDIQIFDSVTTLIPINFFASTQGINYDSSLNNIVIPPHSLFNNTGGSGKEPISVISIPRVLDEAIIPRNIIVHLGSPNQNASNVSVSFINYLKSVASSEIYPTWPTECLYANIYAQISVVLNRVFTEWYISRGYPFHITNSPGYDQKYNHSGIIFDSVSEIVDEVFDTYIRNNGNVEPYFSSYCDGKIISCDGMKQWGSKDLADQGYSATGILRYYFGNGIALYQNSNIQDVEESYPGTPLKVGSSGTAVTTIQRQLSRIVQDFPGFGDIAVDGNFGSGTESVVKAFQRQFALTSDGIVGRSTWYAISYIYVSIKDLSELTSEGEKPTGTPSTGEFAGTTLKVGSSGSSVAELQFYISKISQYNPSIPSLDSDGEFGSATEAAVKAFQSYYGLEVDGIVGQITWDAVYEKYIYYTSDALPPEQGDIWEYPGSPLSNGSSGDNVQAIQFWLNIISYNYSDIPKVTADGKFGPATQAAVEDFQSYFGLTVDGIVGEATWNKLFEVFSLTVNYLLPPGQRPGEYPGTSLKQGSTGDSVREMQFYLFTLSAYYVDITPIGYDGLFGAKTTAAVIQFQQLFNLDDDGIVGRITWTAIYTRFNELISNDGKVMSFYTSAYPGYILSTGATGDRVLEIQYRLQYISMFISEIVPPDQSGTFDEKTYNAVVGFQNVIGIQATGYVDEKTWNSLLLNYSEQLSDYRMAAYNSGIYRNPDSYPGYVLNLGSFGPAVLTLQKQMILVASRYGESLFVEENGFLDEKTETVIKQFQKNLGLNETGTVDKESWNKIFSIETD